MQTHLPQIEDQLALLANGPACPQNYYTDAITYQHVYDLAGHLKKWLEQIGNKQQTVLLVASDKAVITAALMASMIAKKTLLMPNALTESAIDELTRLAGCKFAILDKPHPLPKEIEAIVACNESPSSYQADPNLVLDPKAVWVRLFTGGSTAVPKIWDKTVINLMGEALYLSRVYNISQEDKIVATVPAYHIYGLLYSVLMPFVSAAFVSAGMPYYPNEIVQTLRKEKATVLISVPPHYRALVEQFIESDDLRLAFCSAGMLPENDGLAFTQNNRVDLVEIYGSTETGGIASRIRARKEEFFTPFDCVRIKVDEEYLWVKSRFLSPGLTLSGTGFFKMGDRATITTEGKFMLLGRADGIVKVGGRRVDLEAIRQTLLNQTDVTDAIVFSQEMTGGRENNIIAVVEGAVDMENLLNGLALDLEPYARPRRIKVVTKMPFTAAGKYDRKTLLSLFKNP